MLNICFLSYPCSFCGKKLQSCLTLCNLMVCCPPLSMGFSRLEYWSGLPLPPLAISPTQGSNPCLLCFLHWHLCSLPLMQPNIHGTFTKKKNKIKKNLQLFSLSNPKQPSEIFLSNSLSCFL